MYLKRYTIGSMAFMLFIAWYISQFLGFSGSEAISLFGLPIPSLPIAILVLLPVAILYLMSVLHMAYYSVKSFFHLRNYKKDYELLVDMIMDELLNKDHNYSFKTKPYKLLSKVLQNTSMTIDDNVELTDNEKVNSILNVLSDVKEGKVVELKKFNLSKDNTLVLQNQENSLKSLDLKPETILNKNQNYSKEILQKAFTSYCAQEQLSSIDKYKEYMTLDALYVVLARLDSDMFTLKIPNESLILLLNKLDLKSSDYISISQNLGTHMDPEQRMKLFETLSENEEAQEAYLYTLFDLEMIEQAKEFLDTVGKEDMLKFRAYLTLKESGHNYSINLFI